ncbi:Repressor ROX1 [Mycena venus]|uniref:Repressor ROX1 n=1 Tax=Mycena venus TaxID=2733690 RepID=A0A8H6X753_9AGAR|nr:Repressor ROX1 [Mycena venus]
MPALRTRDTHPAARSLEVNTSAPPPSLTIISPTPRAFTFPISHNLSDSPYSSPSNSPFEPDLRQLALSASSTPSSSASSHNDECRTPPPLSAFVRTLSPVSPASAAAEERRPKKGDDDYVKRPENAFILFRRKCCEDRALSLSSSAPSSIASGPSSADSPSLAANAPGKKQRQADLSKTISQQWKALSPEERAKWEALAKEKKKEHETLHPNYVYRPQRSSNKNRVNTAASSSSPTTQRRKHSAPPAQQQIEFVVPAPRAQHGRSSSAPTPPPHQAIQIPNVYMPVSSSGAFSLEGGDVSLMPMITRRGVGNGNGGFDYLPNFAAFDFEASLQSSDFLRAMFPQPTSPLSTGTGAILSPASSTSGSGPSSPYTPATSSFHPSAFSCNLGASADASSSYTPLGLDSSEPAVVGGTSMETDYTSYTSTWAASSPWGTSSGAGLAEGDFDIGRIPEIGWELGCAAFPAAQPAFPGSEFLANDAEMGELDLGGGDSSELDLHFGDLGMGEMGVRRDDRGAGILSASRPSVDMASKRDS